MRKYYIEDEEGYFWCHNKRIGYWSKQETSKKFRVNRGLFITLIGLIGMRINNIKAFIKRER